MRRLLYLSLLLAVVLLAVRCKEAYEPQVDFKATNLLVVEGFLNGNGVTTIKLSRTQGNNTRGRVVERNATVTIKDDANQEYRLSEPEPGVYRTNVSLASSGKYTLHIRSADGKEYASTEVSLLQTPQIDEVSWKRSGSGLQIYVDTHDPLNNTRYYRWEYEETWEIVPRYISYYELVPKDPFIPGDRFPYLFIRRRPEKDFPRACWQSERSDNIIMASSNKLAQDVIHLQPVCLVPNNSWKLDTRYSILVKQYALSAAGFEYWENMKKNTEGLGSIFDPQPSEIRGNISCISNPEEQVVGFFDASTVSEKRIFLTKSEIGGWLYYDGCFDKYAVNDPDSLRVIFPANIPVDARGSGNRIEGYTGASPECVDCRLKGSPIKPDFW